MQAGWVTSFRTEATCGGPMDGDGVFHEVQASGFGHSSAIRHANACKVYCRCLVK